MVSEIVDRIKTFVSSDVVVLPDEFQYIHPEVSSVLPKLGVYVYLETGESEREFNYSVFRNATLTLTFVSGTYYKDLSNFMETMLPSILNGIASKTYILTGLRINTIDTTKGERLYKQTLNNRPRIESFDKITVDINCTLYVSIHYFKSPNTIDANLKIKTD